MSRSGGAGLAGRLAGVQKNRDIVDVDLELMRLKEAAATIERRIEELKLQRSELLAEMENQLSEGSRAGE